MADREHRFDAMLDAVDAATASHDQPMRMLDLAGGTGSLSIRALRRQPDAEVTVLDLDPVLLHIARATLPAPAKVIAADLRHTAWHVPLAPRSFNAVVTATAMHWMTAPRLAAIYAEVHDLLAPGGIFINADHMDDDGLPTLSKLLADRNREHREDLYRTAAVTSWPLWWSQVAADPELGPLKVERDALFSIHHGHDWTPPLSWHLEALRDAGFAEAGIVWRGGTDAAVAGVRS